MPGATLDLLLGLLLLVAGGYLLVRSASRMAAAWGVPPLVVGLTVVAFGTSAPELVVSLLATRSGQPAIALGNVVGSNTFNALFVLGVSACITPLVVAQQFVRREIPFLIVVSLMVWGISTTGQVSPLAGGALLGLLVLYTGSAVRRARREGQAVVAEYDAEYRAESPRQPWGKDAVLSLLSLALLIVGSDQFVSGATGLARGIGLSDISIALLVVGPGTSFPELATSVVAAFKGERDIAVANVVGSNLFNLLGVLGGTALFGGGVAVPEVAAQIDLPVMAAATVACLPIVVTGHRISRLEGALLLGYYVVYAAWLLLSQTPGGVPRSLTVGLLGFALPITAIGLLLSLVHARRYRDRSAGPPD